MTFLHEEAELGDLLTIVGEAVGIDRALVEKDYGRISPMFWGERFSLQECCEMIRSWLS